MVKKALVVIIAALSVAVGSIAPNYAHVIAPTTAVAAVSSDGPVRSAGVSPDCTDNCWW
jgi:hypothetical protein